MYIIYIRVGDKTLSLTVIMYTRGLRSRRVIARLMNHASHVPVSRTGRKKNRFPIYIIPDLTHEICWGRFQQNIFTKIKKTIIDRFHRVRLKTTTQVVFTDIIRKRTFTEILTLSVNGNVCDLSRRTNAVD